MSSSGNEKVCAICGEDCSNKPRTKDSKGRYYCKPCHERALRAKTKPEPKAATVRPMPPPKPRREEPVSLLDDLIPDAAPVAAAGSRMCANCGSAIASDAIICLNCGFNTQTGHKLDVSVQKPKRDFSGAANILGANGPMFAGVGALAIYAVMALAGNSMGDAATGAAVYSAWHLPFSLAVTVLVLVLAFRESIGTGFLTLCVPCYVLYFVYSVNDNPWSRFLYAAHVIGTVLYIALFYEALGPGQRF